MHNKSIVISRASTGDLSLFVEASSRVFSILEFEHLGDTYLIE